MAETYDSRDFYGKVIFRVIGAYVFAWFLMANPLILRPRAWTARFVMRSMAIDVALLAVGVGFVALRRWAALLFSALAAWVVFESLLWGPGGAKVFVVLVFAAGIVYTVVFWRTLTWGNKLRDSLLILAIVLVDAIVHYAAFEIGRR